MYRDDFTEEDVRLVAEAFRDRYRDVDANARDSLAALQDAGRLLPSGVRMAEEIAVRVDEPHPRRREQEAGQIIQGLERATALHMPKLWRGWTAVRRTVGPWVPVGTEETAE